MWNFFKKKNKSEFALKNMEEQPIPYACHYDYNTLLTKNGELMQVIKIEGLSKEFLKSGENFDLRSIIRKAIADNITDRKISIYFHTIRRKHNLDSANYFAWEFARDSHDAWAKKNYWRDKFVNELYITIIYEGENYNNTENILRSFIPKQLKKSQMTALANNAKTLDDLVLKMLEALKTYGSKRLSIANDYLGAHSEILEFLSKIICLRSKRVAMPIMGLDQVFSRSKVAFGGNCLEILDEAEKHYAAVFSIKEYHEFSAKALDKFLRSSSEYVITQTLNFTDSNTAKKSFEYFNYILGISKDETLREYSGLRSTMESDTGNPTDYAIQQMTVMVIGNTLSELQTSVNTIVKETRKLGIAMIREDLFMALTFWAQLPGNYHYFRRTSFINTKRTASFASLHNTPSGELENPWGKAWTIFRRENGGPHFFNLQIGVNGNTLIAGATDSAKAILANFLLSEGTKYDPNVFYIDQFNTAKVTIKALGGNHHDIDLNQENFLLNPFSLSNSDKNRAFLYTWLLILLFPNNDSNEAQNKVIQEALNKLMEQDKPQLSKLLDLISDQSIKDLLSPWCRPNKFGKLFDNPNDNLGFGVKITGFNISQLVEFKEVIAPYMLYCLYKYITDLNKSPTILMINDANKLLEAQCFINMLPNWLDSLTNNNGLAMLICDTNAAICNNIAAINNKIATYLFMPDLDPGRYQKTLQLTDAEVSAIKNMKLLYRHFMIKQSQDTNIVELNLDGLDFIIKTLTGGKEAINAMDAAIAKLGDNPNRWIVPYYKMLLPDLYNNKK